MMLFSVRSVSLRVKRDLYERVVVLAVTCKADKWGAMMDERQARDYGYYEFTECVMSDWDGFKED